MSNKIKELEQRKNDMLKSLAELNPEATREWAINEKARLEEELRGVKIKEAEAFLDKKEDFVPNENPRGKYRDQKEERQNSFFKRLARFEHYNNKK